MEDPISEIPRVVRVLCQGSPSAQQHAIDTYFTPTASFTHPFCRTGSFQNSRALISYIFRWYKILSPHIDISIDSVAFDQRAMLLYVSMHQVFSIQLLPFYRSCVNLTTVLQLTNSPEGAIPGRTTGEQESRMNGKKRYYIQSQNDLYQTSEFAKFFLPWFGIGTILVMIWQFFATFLCVVGAVCGWPITWLEENVIGGNKQRPMNEIVGAE